MYFRITVMVEHWKIRSLQQQRLFCYKLEVCNYNFRLSSVPPTVKPKMHKDVNATG